MASKRGSAFKPVVGQALAQPQSMDVHKQAEGLRNVSSDLTSLADPNWRAHAQGDSSIAAKADSPPRKRQAVSQSLDRPSHASMPFWSPGPFQAHRAEVCGPAVPQCCAQPAALHRQPQQPAHEHHSSLQRTLTGEACSPSSSRLQHRSTADPAHHDPDPANWHHAPMEQQRHQPSAAGGLETSSNQDKHLLVMEDDGGFVVPVALTDRDIQMPGAPRAHRGAAEPVPPAGRLRRSRAAALACQVRPPSEAYPDPFIMLAHLTARPRVSASLQPLGTHGRVSIADGAVPCRSSTVAILNSCSFQAVLCSSLRQ